MKVYCGDYANYKPPRRDRWIRLGVLALSLVFMSAATPAMIGYYWNGQNSTGNLQLDEAMRLAQDPNMPVYSRKSAQVTAYAAAKRIIKMLKSEDQVPELEESSKLLIKKLHQQSEDDQ